jgi:hypothetical protein
MTMVPACLKVTQRIRKVLADACVNENHPVKNQSRKSSAFPSCVDTFYHTEGR